MTDSENDRESKHRHGEIRNLNETFAAVIFQFLLWICCVRIVETRVAASRLLNFSSFGSGCVQSAIRKVLGYLLWNLFLWNPLPMSRTTFIRIFQVPRSRPSLLQLSSTRSRLSKFRTLSYLFPKKSKGTLVIIKYNIYKTIKRKNSDVSRSLLKSLKNFSCDQRSKSPLYINPNRILTYDFCLEPWTSVFENIPTLGSPIYLFQIT